MKLALFVLLLITIAGSSACGPQDATPLATLPPPSPSSDPVIKTSIGDFKITSARFVNEMNGAQSAAGEMILLVFLAHPSGEKLDPATFSLEAFNTAIHDLTNGEVHLSGDDGSYTISTMAGWVGDNYDEFAMGFRVPKAARTFQLFWPGNKPIDLSPIY